MDRSLHPPLLQNRACHFHGTRLLSVVMLVTHTWRQVVPPWLGKSAFGGGRHDALPGRHQGLALCLGSSPLTHSLTFHNAVLTSAYPGHYPGPWLLEESFPIRHAVGTYSDLCRRARMRLLRSQFPLLASLGRCFPPGFSAVLTGQYFRLPAPYPVPFGSSASASCAGSFSRWLNHTFACAAHRCLLDGIPGLRLPGSAFYPRFRPLRTSRGSGGYACTPAPGGRGLHPHGN
jgi:hypothetical protein